MTRNRFILALLVAGIAAAIVLLIPRYETGQLQLGPELVVGERSSVENDPIESPVVPWPSPPSASPLTSEPPAIIIEPSNPQAALLFREVNERRISAGHAIVLTDGTLNNVAQLHADDMARRTYLEHVTPEGVTFEMRIDASGYAYRSAAENLGFASHTSLIVPDWMRSPGHRANIENGSYRRVGVAVAEGKWQGIDVIFAAMVFAEPN
jgi:uncharacterized protein YkwD